MSTYASKTNLILRCDAEVSTLEGIELQCLAIMACRIANQLGLSLTLLVGQSSSIVLVPPVLWEWVHDQLHKVKLNGT
jgi:hypothetical protein